VDLGRVGAAAELHVAVPGHLRGEPPAQGHLPTGDPVPLGLELRHRVGVEVPVRRGVDRRDIDRVVLDADLRQAELLHLGDAR
jgi:hypothetical protein